MAEERTRAELSFVDRIVVARVAPPLTLAVVLTVLGLFVNGGRLGLDLAGGRLLPVGDLGQLWSAYLAGWHPVGGGTAGSAPASLAVLGGLGAVFAPVGGPHALVAVLLLGDAPLAGLAAYFATRRLRVSRWSRAGAAAVYALLPAATAGVAQGRLEVVAVHILLPLVTAGVVAVLAGGEGWLHIASWCALGVALLGAFSPLAQGLAVLGLVAGFVVLPSDRAASAGWKRVASVGIVVLLPLALLLPWPTTLVNQPALILHGLSGPGTAVTPTQLIGLDPGGPGALPAGIAVVVAAVAAVALRPRSLTGPATGMIMLGVCGLVVVRLAVVKPLQGGPSAPGFAGVPLLMVGAGLLWLVLASLADAPARVRRLRTPAVLAWVVLVAIAGAAALTAGREGPLRAGGGDRLAATQADELGRSGRSVLVLGEDGAPPRQSGGGFPRFGDDQLALSPGTPDRLTTWQAALVQPSSDATRGALAAAASSGALFVVLPHGVGAAPVVAVAPDLAVAVEQTRDGRAVLRLLPPSGEVVLVPPGVAKQAVTASSPATSLGVTPVDAALPDVRVRVSEGVAGRLLVLAAEQEPGWRVTVDGKAVPIVPAWGHQVAVAVPTNSSTVIVSHTSTMRDILLLGEIAALLFTALTSIPARRRAKTGEGFAESYSPSMTSGSTPR
ncbi:hypothetical protein [Amycolatopsis pigmentata]|uniref:YfhO family protein n=1 Tax=Amycolatopsis pigmentata TaxID=450801 RepID=A0ABW5FX81_9PSEU